MSDCLKGIAASGGVAIGKAFLLIEPELTVIQQKISNSNDEVTRFHSAVENAKQELEIIRDRAAEDLGEENAAIFDAHLLVLSDPELFDSVENKIESETINAEFALQETANF